MPFNGGGGGGGGAPASSFYDNGNGGSSKTITFDNGTEQKLTLNSAVCNVTVVGPASGKPATVNLQVYNPSNYTINWVTAMLASGGLKPVINTASGATAHDWVVLHSDGDSPPNLYCASSLPSVS